MTTVSLMNNRVLKSIALISCIFLAFAANALSLIGGGEEEPLLEASEAFKTEVSLDQTNKLNVAIDIAPGYFLYRSKIKVSSDQAEFNDLVLPAGKKKQDQFFGEVETYRNRLDYSAEVLTANAAGDLKVKVTSQGCADVGICYPPHSEIHTVNLSADQFAALSNSSSAQNNTLLVAGPSTSPAAGSSTSLSTGIATSSNTLAQLSGTTSLQQDPIDLSQDNAIGSFGGSSAATTMASPVSSQINSESAGGATLADMLSVNGGDEVLDPEVAFTMSPATLNDGVATFQWNILDGHYLYKKRFSFEVLSPAGASAGPARIPEGLWEEDAFFGNSEVFRGGTEIQLPVQLAAGQTEAVVKVGYQGCADIGICYPPIFKEIQLTASGATLATFTSGQSAAGNTGSSSGLTEVAALSSVAASNSNAAVPLAEQDRLANSLKNNNRWITIATFFGMGLLLTFTPCVLPMIPILSSIIVGNGNNISTGRAFTLSLIYVLAMALTYTIAGVLVGLSGENIQATLQHPYVLTTFALLFVALSFSMFGYYELQMPQFIQNRLSSVSNQQKSGSFSGVATMGFLSALIVGPCVTAPLVGALIYIGQTGDAVLGGAALFALSMGMGLPLLIIGTTFGKYLPKAGAWMDVTKAIFGVMLLGLAIYMLDRVIPSWATMLLSALLLITVAMFMGVFDSLSSEAPGWRRVSKGFGFAALVYGTLLMIGVATGTGTLFKPMQGLSLAGNQGGTTEQTKPTFETVKTVDDLNARLVAARASNTPVMFDFYADWCISCKEMEAFTFSDPVVASKMNRAVLLKADVTANDEADKALLKEFGIFGPPAIIFYDKDGVEQRASRVVGFMPAEKFTTVLDRVFN